MLNINYPVVNSKVTKQQQQNFCLRGRIVLINFDDSLTFSKLCTTICQFTTAWQLVPSTLNWQENDVSACQVNNPLAGRTAQMLTNTMTS